MGLIKSGAIIVISFLLFLSLFAGNLFLSVSWSLEYNTIEPGLKNITDNLAEEWNLVQEINSNYPLMQLGCQNGSNFILNKAGYTFDFTCESINQGPNVILQQGIDSAIQQIYYKQYDCEFWNCLKQQDDSTVLISETAKDYWKSKFYLALIISIILFILLIIIESKKSTAFLTLGILTIVSALPFKKIDWIFSIFPESSILDFISLFFTKSENVFIIVLIIGIGILALGIGIKIFKYGIKVTNWFRKENEEVKPEDVKEIVKEEIKKDNLKEKMKKEIKKEMKTESLKKEMKKGKK